LPSQLWRTRNRTCERRTTTSEHETARSRTTPNVYALTGECPSRAGRPLAGRLGFAANPATAPRVLAPVVAARVADKRRRRPVHHRRPVRLLHRNRTLEVSSGDVVRHRLSRAGNRRLNNALHVAALSNKRYDPRGKTYYQRKLAAGEGKKGSLRCLKRRLSDVVFRTLVEDRARANPGGQMGATLTASAVDQIPKVNTSDKPQPGFVAEATPTRPLAKAAP
jgi:transposase